MYYSRPDRKEYEIHITSKGDILAILEYQQASMLEVSNFYQYDTKDEVKILRWLKKFIFNNIKHGSYTRKLRETKQKAKKRITDYIVRNLDWDNILEQIKSTYFFGGSSIYDGKDPSSFVKSSGVKGNSHFSYDLALICEKYNITPSGFMQNYTLEQYNYMMDGILFQNFEGSDDGRRFNKSISYKKGDGEKIKKSIRAQFSKYKV